MDYTKIDGLIEKDESLELYELQCEIINSETLTDNEKLLRLAIMQTNCPVDDWENAAEILRNYVTELHGEALLIAAYIAVTAYELVRYEKADYFIDLLAKENDLADDSLRSIAEYLRARYLKEKGADAKSVIKVLENSIRLCPEYAMHYIILADYKAFDEKVKLLDKALSRIKKVRAAEELWCLPESYFVEPANVMTTITSTDVSESWYNELEKRRNEINGTERYELFKEALNHCGKFLLDLSDEDIAYHIFEEFDGDCTSFLNEKNLERLRLSNKITIEIVDMALELSSKFRSLENTKLWNVHSVRGNERWREIMELSDQIKTELTQLVDRTRCFDCFNRKVYRLFNAENGRGTGYLTEYMNHPTVVKSIAIGVQRNESYDVIGQGSLTVYYKNGEQYSFACYTDTVFSGQFGITVSDDGERIYVISDVKGLWCYDKHGNVIWKTRYTSAGQVYPHRDGTVTCVTGRHLILLDENGKPIKKRVKFDGVDCEISEKTIGILTSENVAAIIDVQTLEPILKISLSKLNIDRFRDIIEAGEYYVLQGCERIGIFDLPDGKRDIREKEVIYLLSNNGDVLRKIENPTWTFVSRAYVDRETNEVVLYALYKHHTDGTYRIPIE